MTTCSSQLREKNVIQIHKNKFVQHVKEYIINESLKNTWCHLVFEMSKGSVKGRFPFISLPDANEMVGVP